MIATGSIHTNGTNGSAPYVNGKPAILKMAEANHIPPKQHQTSSRRFQPMSLTDLLAMPPKAWMIDQVLGRGDIGMIFGPPGSGKTFVIIDLIFSACLATQFARRFDIPQLLTVAYCAGEGASGLPSRFAAAAQRYNATTLPNFTFFNAAPSLYADELDSIKTFIVEWRERQDSGEAQPLDILIIDTLHSATAGADENSARDMGVVLDFCRQATKILGVQ